MSADLKLTSNQSLMSLQRASFPNHSIHLSTLDLQHNMLWCAGSKYVLGRAQVYTKQ